MKTKRTMLTALCLCALIGGLPVFAQNVEADTGFNVNKYAEYFGVKSWQTTADIDNYVYKAPKADRRGIWSNLGGEDSIVDTPLEFALLSYYSQPVVTIRPVEAVRELPANTRTSEIKLAAATYKELQEVRFLDAQSEINSALRAGIADIADEEFNKISFLLENSRTFSARSHSAVLIRNPQNGQYKLSYGGTYTNNETREITATTLDTLLAEIGRRKTDFDQTGINQVRAQAALIPAVTIPAEVNKVKNAFINFYTTPNSATFGTLTKIYGDYNMLKEQERAANASFANAIYAFSSELGARLTR